jgi:hypothetical protein
MDTKIELSILDKYIDYTYIFSKKESDLLSLYRQYDYKIELENNNVSILK